jgi:ribosomal protein L11 methyltransferase
MPNYLEIIIPEGDPARRDLLVPALEALGFEGFEEGEEEVKAYIAEGRLDEAAFSVFAGGRPVRRSILADQNWNQLWESSFEPVVIDDFCAVRAHFHPPVNTVQHEIVITPKMSFGTGHHATTRLMIEYMRELPLEGKRVVDFGTGTGVLAILAERLGARAIWALDNDPWAIDNARENKDRNGAVLLSLHLSATLDGVPPADVILANINRPILVAQMQALYHLLSHGGLLLLSGILAEDQSILETTAGKAGFLLHSQRQQGDWVAQLWKKGDPETLGIGQNTLT